MELEKIILNKVWLRRPKITCSPSYVDYRLKTNAVILLDTGHTLGRNHTWDKARERNQKLELVDVLTV
jgi:hypothetical protein